MGIRSSFKSLGSAVVFLCVVGFTVPASAGPVLLGTLQIGNSFSTPQILESARPVLFYLGPANEILSPLFEDFASPSEYPTDIGETVWSGNDPDFLSFASRLTDGSNDELGVDAWVNQSPIGGGGGRESDLLLLVPAFGPDLIGYEIDHVTEVLTVDRQSPGSDPFGDGVNTDWSVKGRYDFYGTPVPEPTTITLLACGAVTACWRRHWPGVLSK